MRYTTYYEERDTITVGKYQQMKQSLGAQPEYYTLRKLQFMGNETQKATAAYALCIKNEEEDLIYLEKKYRQNGMYYKKCEKLTREECQKILNSDLEWMKGHKKELLSDFYLQVTLNHLSPGYLTEYEGERFVPKKGHCIQFVKKINRGVGITNHLFEEPEIMISCIDEGKVLVTYKKAAKLPQILGSMLQLQEEANDESSFVF